MPSSVDPKSKPSLSKSALSAAVITVGATAALVFHIWFRDTGTSPPSPRWAVSDADPEHGRRLLRDRGCGACHVVPGVRGAAGRVGPPLEGMRQRIYIAGRMPNTPQNLVAWIRAPQEISPGTAMPNLGVTEEEARDMAAHLYR